MPPPAKPSFTDAIAVATAFILHTFKGVECDASIAAGRKFADRVGREYPSLVKYMDDN